ncbi:hypothetical protein T01_12495 [Trichinella spiralis]|uniref:Uncharacterized protein n=1 Tax=Trichinella spiralis TaxID=6334 RepID=A0A0V0Z2G1_TRISP|nr:hypothetical protein T01_12495 [Trichinella spiralis]
MLFELWLDEAKSLTENLYNDEYNGPNAKSNVIYS